MFEFGTPPFCSFKMDGGNNGDLLFVARPTWSLHYAVNKILLLFRRFSNCFGYYVYFKAFKCSCMVRNITFSNYFFVYILRYFRINV